MIPPYKIPRGFPRRPMAVPKVVAAPPALPDDLVIVFHEKRPPEPPVDPMLYRGGRRGLPRRSTKPAALTAADIPEERTIECDREVEVLPDDEDAPVLTAPLAAPERPAGTTVDPRRLAELLAPAPEPLPTWLIRDVLAGKFVPAIRAPEIAAIRAGARTYREIGREVTTPTLPSGTASPPTVRTMPRPPMPARVSGPPPPPSSAVRAVSPPKPVSKPAPRPLARDINGRPVVLTPDDIPF